LPTNMSLYITTSPPEAPYTQQSYHWPDAPVRLVDQIAFFAGLTLRVKMREENIKGFAFSYGWNDVMRWIERGKDGEEGERDGWAVLQRDLQRAAESGLRVWRMKVMVVGS